MYKFTKEELKSFGFSENSLSTDEDIANFNENIKNAFFAPTRKLCAKIAEISYVINSDKTETKTMTDKYFSNTDIQSISIERSIQSEESFIGNAISKKYEIKIIDKNQSYDFANKRLKPYIGIEYTDKNIYVPFPEAEVYEAVYDSTSKLWTLTCYDDMLRLEDTKLKEIECTDSEITLREYLGIICLKVGITTSSNPFFNEDIKFSMKDYKELSDNEGKKMPNFSGEENLRTVVAQIAQAALGNAIINRNGELEIVSFNNADDSNENLINETAYFKFELNRKYGPVNTVVLSRSNADNVYSEAVETESVENEPSDFKGITMCDGFTPKEKEIYEAHIKNHGNCELKIIDNAFLDSLSSGNERQENARKIFDYIKGYEVNGFKMNFRGNPMIDEGDRIGIVANSKKFYTNYMYDNIMYDGSLKVSCGCNEIAHSNIDYQKAEGIGELIRKTQFEVDKKIGQISSKVSEMEIEQGAITEKMAEMVVAKDEITSIVSKSGGSNLIKNSAFYKTDNKLYNWELSENCSYEITGNEDTSCQRKLRLKNGSFTQDLELVQNETYTLACLFKNPKVNTETETSIKIEYDANSSEEVFVTGSDEQASNMITLSHSFEVKSVNPKIVISINNETLTDTDILEISDLRITKGDVENPWTQHAEEIYGKSHKLDSNGLIIGNISESNGTTQGDVLHLDQDSLVFKSSDVVQSELNSEKCMAHTGEFKTMEIGNVHFVHVTDARIFITKGDN